MPRDKRRSRRRSSSYSSESSYERKKSKSKHKRRSRSRERSESSYKKDKYRRSISRSSSRERYSKSRKRSSSRSRPKKSSKHSVSRDRSRSQSSSRSKIKSTYTRSKYSSKRRSRSESSNSSSSERVKPADITKIHVDDTERKLQQAIEAAKAAGLTMTKLPTYEYKDIPIKEEMPSIHDRNIMAELNSDSFVPKSFSSSRSKKFSENIVIDLNSDTVKVPDVEFVEEDSLLKLDELPSEEELREMWYKKLYQYRKKMLKEET